jgi:rifampicin phosphotransferase
VRYILTPAEAASSPHAGGKARALALAMRGGLPVPPWVVLAASAFDASAVANGIAARTVPDHFLRVIEGGEAPKLLRTLELAPEVLHEVTAALEQLCADGALLAVRSSASDEDGPEHSFAGQLESFLSVPAVAVPARVRDVWLSGFSARIVAYRREHGLPPVPRPPAVLIQRMVHARVAGVAFSADPVSGQRGRVVISAVPGLGSALVSGEAEADAWLVNREHTIVERRITPKRLMHRPDSTRPGGVAAEPLGEDRGSQPALTDAEVLEIAALARRAARQFGRPQDIEWAYEDARLWLLQARPITSLSAMPDPDAALLVWDNSNIVESYSGVTTPLTFSFTSDIYEHVYREFCRLMGVSERRTAAHDESFRNMLGLIRGRLYYNLLNWYRMLALLPGFAVNRRFMEQMMGVGEPLPADLAGTIAAGARTGRVRDAAHVVRALARIAAAALTIGRRVRRFELRLDAALASPDPPLEERRPEELVRHYRDLRSRLLLRWDAPIVNDFLAMVAYGMLRRLTVRWLGDPGGTLQNDLVGGEGGMVSAEPAIRLRQLARQAAADPALLERLLADPLASPAGAFAAWPQFRHDLQAYLEKFGERTVNELKLESETLHDDPTPLVRAIASFARQLTADAAQADLAGGHLRAEARARAERRLQAHPLRRRVFRRVLAAAQARLRDRENLRLERTRLFGRVRRVFLELGRRFHALGLLDAPRDIFYLEIDEVLGFVEGRATTTNLRALVALRRAEFRSFADGPPPDERFETRGVVYHAHPFRRPAAPVIAREGERQGLGCSPGVVRGPVQVVRDPNEVDLTRRAVLVAEHTDPGWILVFPTALGVLVERGSLLSHAAIVARELGIPAIVSVPGLTGWLRDGDWVEFDGTTGVIRRIDAPARPVAHAQ